MISVINRKWLGGGRWDAPIDPIACCSSYWVAIGQYQTDLSKSNHI